MNLVSWTLVFVFCFISLSACSASAATNADIQEFWSWFQKNELGSNNLSVDPSELSQRLHKIDKRLVWEITSSSSEKQELAISANHHSDLFPVVEQIVSTAPDLKKWEVVSAGQPIPSQLLKRFSPAKFTVQTALNWLPYDIETIQVYQDYQLPSIPDPPDINTDTADNEYMKHCFYGRSAGRLAQDTDKSSLYSLLAGQEVRLAVSASKDFSSPHGNTENLYAGCNMLLFENSIPKEFFALLNEKPANEIFEYGKYSIFSMKAKWGDDSLPLYICIPANNLLLIATSNTILQTVLDRMDDDTELTQRAFPDNLPDWKYIDKKSHYWATRHFREKQPPDLFGYFSPEAGFTSKNRPVGFISQLSGAPLESITLTVLATDPLVAKQTNNLLLKIGEGRLHTSLRQISNEAWSISIRKDDDLNMYFFFVDALLGHAIVI